MTKFPTHDIGKPHIGVVFGLTPSLLERKSGGGELMPEPGGLLEVLEGGEGAVGGGERRLGGGRELGDVVGRR